MAIQKVGVLGCGLMGSGIAQVSAQAGFPTVVREVSQNALEKGVSSIYKFLQAMFESGKSALSPRGPRNFGLALISLGVWALAIACLQYWREMRRFDPGRTPFSLTLAVAGFVALFGILALMNMLFHVGPF